MNYSQNMSPRPPLPQKVGGGSHDPQLLWERRPWIKADNELSTKFGKLIAERRATHLQRLIAWCSTVMSLR